ncbi:DJ-1/PfpI family protein [Arthrobacter sp. 2YAF22_2]|uniref:DJ-1/PfpI family protein n=1 Tax=Arthrobacter sp. 2YAF22_2 TaxID=3233029 RepID=UPI003F914585
MAGLEKLWSSPPTNLKIWNCTFRSSASSKPAVEIARSFFTANKPVAAICHGPYLVVSADLVKGRRLTSYWGDGVPDEITQAGGTWEDADVVVDGNLVISRWPMDLAAFSREMMKLVAGRA